METLNFAIPTLFGLEALAADELRRLGLDQVRAENGRVLCSGRPGDIPRMDLNLRTGERVLLVLGTFPAGDFDALFEGTRALPWEQFIPREGRFPVKGHCLNSALHSVPACQSIVKKAAAARLGDAYGLNTLPETGALYPDPVLHHERHRRPDAGHHRDQAFTSGATGPTGWTPPCGRPWPPPWCSSPATGAGTRCATPSAARAPSPSRPPSSPKTGPRA